MPVEIPTINSLESMTGASWGVPADVQPRAGTEQPPVTGAKAAFGGELPEEYLPPAKKRQLGKQEHGLAGTGGGFLTSIGGGSGQRSGTAPFVEQPQQGVQESMTSAASASDVGVKAPATEAGDRRTGFQQETDKGDEIVEERGALKGIGVRVPDSKAKLVKLELEEKMDEGAENAEERGEDGEGESQEERDLRAWMEFMEGDSVMQIRNGIRSSYERAEAKGSYEMKDWRTLMQDVVTTHNKTGWVFLSFVGIDLLEPRFFAIREANYRGQNRGLKPAYPLVRRILASFLENLEES